MSDVELINKLNNMLLMIHLRGTIRNFNLFSKQARFLPKLNKFIFLFSRYEVNHEVGMTLSKKMDDYFLYVTLLIVSLITIWSLNIAAYLNYQKGRDQVTCQKLLSFSTRK